MSRASYAALERVDSQSPSYNPIYSYQEPLADHTVSFLDAVTFLNQLRAVRGSELGGIAISRLGQEDPQIWDVLAMKDVAHPQPEEIAALGHMKTQDTITNVGQGEIVTVDDTRDDGTRKITLEKNDRYSTQYTSDFPTYPSLYHQGAGGEHEIALTFDDGPDPTWTPTGAGHPETVQREGHLLPRGQPGGAIPGAGQAHRRGGSRDREPHLHACEPRRHSRPRKCKLELNATQRLIESITGRSTTLFRPPYNADSRPSDLGELVPLKQVQDDLGYLIVLENIDPEDWARPGADVIVDRIKEERRNGSLILLHDAGGNREQTVEALPQIIDWLQTRGDHIVPLSDLLHIPLR